MIDPPYDPLIVQEVGLRDGLQMETVWVETEEKVSLIDGCAAAGMSRIEASSFVSPTAVPPLRDAEDVFARIARRPGTIYVALVANVRGARRAIAARADELNMVVSASEAHNLANTRMRREESLEALAQIDDIRREFEDFVERNRRHRLRLPIRRPAARRSNPGFDRAES